MLELSKELKWWLVINKDGSRFWVTKISFLTDGKLGMKILFYGERLQNDKWFLTPKENHIKELKYIFKYLNTVPEKFENLLLNLQCLCSKNTLITEQRDVSNRYWDRYTWE